MEIKTIAGDFTVCKVTDYSRTKLDSAWCFIGKTDASSVISAKSLQNRCAE